MRKQLILFLILFVAIIGCAHQESYVLGRDFDESKLTQIVKKKTPQYDVREIYGDPNDIDLSNDGQEKWTYYYSEESTRKEGGFKKTPQVQRRLKRLTFTFNNRRIVQDYEFSDNTTPVELELDKKK